jgi:hypothetical protein
MAITQTVLTTALVKQELMWADSQRKADYQANAVAANALIENTTARLEILSDVSDKKTRKAKIYWNDVCGVTPGTTAPNFCTITGTAPNSAAKEFEITKYATSSFELDEALYVNNQLKLDEVFADTMLKHLKALDEKIAQVSVSSLDAFVQANANTGGIGCTDETGDWVETFINPSYWSPSIMSYFAKTAILNKFSNPFLLDGSNLFDHYTLAQVNSANADGKGAANMFSLMKMYSDLFNVEAVSAGSTYMINRGTVAFASKAWWTGVSQNAPVVDSEGRQKFSIKSNNIQGLEYDVYITSTCSGRFEKHNVLIVAEYDILNGAPACDDATGVLKFTCGACPTVTP